MTSDTQLLSWSTYELDAPSGSFSFGDRITGLPGINNTGDGFATFLLGQAGRALATDQPQPTYLRRRAFVNSVSDQWQVSPNLTLSVRVRIRADGPRLEKYDRQSSFDPAVRNPRAGSMGALVFAGLNGTGRAFQPFRVRTEPRLGLSWSPTASRNTVVRGTLLRTYSTVGLRTGPFATQGYTGRRLPLSWNRQLVPAVVLEDGFPPLPNPLPDLRGDFANNTDVDMIPRTGAQPTLSYGLVEIERKLPKGPHRPGPGADHSGPGHADRRSDCRSQQGSDRGLGVQGPPQRRELPAIRASLSARAADPDETTSIRVASTRYDEGSLNLQKRTGEGLSFDFEYSYRNPLGRLLRPGHPEPPRPPDRVGADPGHAAAEILAQLHVRASVRSGKVHAGPVGPLDQAVLGLVREWLHLLARRRPDRPGAALQQHGRNRFPTCGSMQSRARTPTCGIRDPSGGSTRKRSPTRPTSPSAVSRAPTRRCGIRT